MHGLIFVTWEKYLSERFGEKLLHDYREKIGETFANAPLASRLYDDATLLAGIGAAHQLTHVPVDTLLREYGRYFIINGLTSHLCTYVLSQVESGRDLLLTMRDVHARLRRTEEGLTPPLFNYEVSSHPNAVILTYDSPRGVCPLLKGAIEGAAERYGEQVTIFEHSCMKRGAPVCRFEAIFTAPASDPYRYSRTPEQKERQAGQRYLATLVHASLPDAGVTEGVTLTDLQRTFRYRWRPAILLEALQHLQFAGLVTSTANRLKDDLAHRRYWRVRVFWE
ncbi:MAG TPA: heme NO-binding domain-containing protein [Ktedonobacteraceae bacterium]|jgi:predicted hydrocarbon binding protein|nr:heme NO-binding domain-containing protein [Ktedonobacteraceae bacterium]